MKNWLNVIRQTTTSECGLCCIAMMAGYYGYVKPISYYRNTYHVGRDGISIKEMYVILERLHLSPKVYQLNDIEAFEFGKLPYILLTKEKHYIVLQKRKEQFVICDPAKGRRKVTRQDLEEINGGLILAVSPGELFVSEKENVNNYRHVKRFFMEVAGLFLAVLVVSALAYLVSVNIPRIIESVVNSIVYQQSVPRTEILVYLLLLAGLFFVISSLQNSLTIKLQRVLNSNVTLYTIKHTLKLPYAYFDDRGEGNILYRLGLVPQLTDIISNSFVQAVLKLLGIVIISIYTIYRFPYLLVPVFTMVAFLGISLVLFNLYIMSKRQEEMLAEASASEIKTEIVTMIFQIKSARLTNYFYDYYKEHFEGYNSVSSSNKKKIYTFNLIVNTYSMFVPILMVVYVVHNVDVSVGELFLLYSIIGMILSNSTMFFSEITSILMIKPSLLYLNDIYDEKEQVHAGNQNLESFKSLEVRDLSFRYNDNTGEVIHGMDLRIREGEKVSIVGLSGSGKSTLIKLLSGLYTNYSGEILFNGEEMKNISEKFFGQEVAVVAQNASVFNKSIRDNVTFGKQHVSEEDIWQALEMVNLADTVRALPLGLNTIINNNGENFSGGQCQRLAMAGAIAKKPGLLILDEATSSMDALNEHQIYRNLKNSKIAVLVISHRLSTVIDSDTIYVIDRGTIVGSGVHDELLKTSELYMEIYRSQNSSN